MTYWKRRGTDVVGDFCQEHCRQLYWHVDRYRTMLAEAEMWQRARKSGQGELFLNGSVAVAHRRAMAIVTRRRIADREWDSLRQMVDDADMVLTTLRTCAKQLVLAEPEQISAWIWTLYECAMDIAWHAGIPWGQEGPADPSGLSLEARADHRTVTLLLTVVGALVDAAGFSVWPVD